MIRRTSQPLLLYVATRALTLGLLVPEYLVLVGLSYSRLALNRLGPVQGLWEYPWPLSALLQLPLLLGAKSVSAYIAAWIAAALLADAAFSWLLWRTAGRRYTTGWVIWLLVPPALGPLVLVMPDIFPAVATAAALFALSRARHAWAGGLLGLGAALKLWPLAGLAAVLVPGSKRDRGRLLRAIIVVGLVAAAGTLWAGGWDRLWSPFIWQRARGLQVEAVAALPLLWARHLAADPRWITSTTAFNSYEIQGPWVDAAMRISTLAMLLGLVALAIVHLRAFRAGSEARTPELAARLVLLAVLVFILTNKVFSPQYLMWIAAPLALLGAWSGAKHVHQEGALFVAACALTQLVYPLNYGGITGNYGPGAAFPGETTAWVLGALTLRDGLLVALAVRVARQVWRATAAGEKPVP